MSARQFLAWLANGFKHLPTDDWQAGDLAECLESRWLIVSTGDKCEGPSLGQILRVEAVDEADGLKGLAFEGLNYWWAAACFRKIRPQQREACSPAFADKMKRLRPMVDA